MKDSLELRDDLAPSVPWASLRYRDFSLLFVGSFFITIAQQMRQTQNLYQVYDLSGSAFLLGMTGLAQAVPLFVVGLFGGTLADLMDRRTLSCLTMAGNFLVAVSLGVLTLIGAIQVWHILVATALTSALNIILYPARMAMISGLVPRSHLTNAAALNSSVAQGAHFIGPMCAGVALALASAGNAYLFNSLAYIPASAAFLMIKNSAESDRVKTAMSLRGLLDGARFLWLQRIVFALVIMDFVIMSVGYYRPLLPVFAKDIFRVGPAAFGMLASAPAIGGTLGTVAVLVMGDVRRKGQLALWAFLVFSICLGAFAVTRSFWTAIALVAGLGLTNSLQAVMRQTSFHLLTPDHLRGRAFSVFNMFSQGANAVGAMIVGFLASLVGAPGALLTGSGVGLALTLSVWALWPEVKSFEAAPAEEKVTAA
ncbi:MAG TPA: MFS transporter [Candidatus Binatia bacterium]|nr:MFS transporter [Candidatus Binatia bacterium]